jgi:hypothetical protein
VFYRAFLLLSVVLCLQGCILVPFINSAKQSGLLQSDREGLLEKDVERFHRIRFWGKTMKALSYTNREHRDQVRDYLRAHSDDEKVVESEIEFIDFFEESYKAEVLVQVKYYRVPYYVVEERIEKQQWEFSVGSGWKVNDIEIEEPPSGI